MGRISRRRIDPEIEERIFEIFWKHLSSLNTAPDVKIFFTSLLSYTEQVMVAKRLAIAVLLSKDLTYQEISETIKVSKSTIVSVHKQLFVGAPGYKKAVEKILAGEKLEKFANKLESLSLSLSPPKSYGSSSWKVKSRKGKEVSKRRKQITAV